MVAVSQTVRGAGRRFSTSRAAVALLVLVTTVAPAYAQAPVAPGSLRYQVSSACPDESAFRARVASRFEAPPERWSGISLVVTAIASTPAQGTLVVIDPSGTAVRRDVQGDSCDEVVSAMALIAAVLLEGYAASAPPPAPAAVATASSPPALVNAPLPVERESTGSSAPSFEGAFGAHGVFVGGVAPSLAAGFRALAELGLDGPGYLEPALRLSFVWTAPTSVASSSAAIRMSFMTGRAEVCPVRLGALGLAWIPCASFDVGQIAGDPGTGSRARLWLAPGLVARAAWKIAPFLDLELEGGLSFPLMRYRFLFEPAPVVYQIPAVGGTGGIGAVIRFP